MLVDPIEVVDQPNVAFAPTLVRLESQQRLRELFRGALRLVAYQRLPVLGGWHTGSADGKGRVRCRVRNGVMSEVVKTGPERVHRVAQDERYGIRDRGRVRADLGDALAMCTIYHGKV